MFTDNDTTTAVSTTATLGAAGDYDFHVAIKDGQDNTLGMVDISTITVEQILSGIEVSPTTGELYPGQTQEFTATLLTSGGSNSTRNFIRLRSWSGQAPGRGRWTATSSRPSGRARPP